MEILCFYAGTAFLYYKSLYPLFFAWILFFFRPKARYFIYFIIAVVWANFHQWWYASNFSTANVLKNVNLRGYISSIPQQSVSKTLFNFQLETINKMPNQATVLLSCYGACPHLHAGQHWEIQAKLKKPLTPGNPGGFDYARWLNSKHIEWVGVANKKGFTRLPGPASFPILRWRENLSTQLTQLVDKKELGILEALTIGITTDITKEQWDLFRRTGTTHLIDISGEHIALVAGFVFWLSYWLWSHLGNLCLRFPAPKFASLMAMLIAIFYAFIAGFSVPTQRALLTCCLIYLCNFFPQKLHIWQVWRYALLLILIFEPHSVLSIGFYFSFLAVGILIVINQKIQWGKLWKLLMMQLACLLGLMPLSAYWFSYASFSGIVANCFAIPWVGLFIVPYALVITFISPWFVMPGSFEILGIGVTKLVTILQFIDSACNLNYKISFENILLPISLMVAMALLLFSPWKKFKLPLFSIFGAAFFPGHEKIAPGHAIVDVLDVGQGLAVAIRTTHHTVLYDTGVKFFQGSDSGKLVLVPYLNRLGISCLDKVIISHPDLDHRGGYESLQKEFRINELIVNEPDFYHRGLSCRDYPEWNWDGINFKFFPVKLTHTSTNNTSCVLKITQKIGSILLTGDIEKSAESSLIQQYNSELRSTFLLIPHHGSKTSSSPAFIQTVAPKYALVSYGFDNLYHFPHQAAIDNYHAQNIPIYNTVDCGRIQIKMEDSLQKPACFRFKSAAQDS